MPTKTIYVRDMPLWKKASRLVRWYEDRSLSAHLEEHLEAIVKKYGDENVPEVKGGKI